MQYEEIIAMVKEVSHLGLTSFEFTEGDIHISMNFPEEAKTEKELKNVSGEEHNAETGRESREAAGQPVKSPLVGTFYAAPAEGHAPFVKVGDRVTRGQTLGIVEAMKLMNEIESEYDGVVQQILVQDKTPVEYGQTLFYIKAQA